MTQCFHLSPVTPPVEVLVRLLGKAGALGNAENEQMMINMRDVPLFFR